MPQVRPANGYQPKPAGRNIADAARWYASLGYPVLPVAPGRKTPLTAHGLQDATTALETIAQWYRRWPQANLGLRTDGLLVLDIDSGSQWPPEPLRLAIKAQQPALQRTPRGGWHIIFRLPPDADWRPRAGRLAEYVDTRCGALSYILVPPSRTDCGQYRWIRPLQAAGQLPPPPAELVCLLDGLERPPPARPPIPLDGPIYWAGGLIRQGQRNDKLFRFACLLRPQGAAESDIYQALTAANRYAVPPLEEPELLRIAKSATRYAPYSGNTLSVKG